MEQMDSREDLSFGAIAIRLQLATTEQIADALKIQKQMRGLGIVPKKLGEILVEKGYLTQAHVQQIFWEQGIKGGHTQIAGYKILAKIGEGAMGAVYKATQLSMDRVVAVKVLPAKYAENKGFIERFFREARAVAKLNHPNIVQGIDVGESNGVHYFAMEYLEGFTVGSLLKRGGSLEEKRAAQVCLQIARALEHAHQIGLIHRDIKPDNIMVTRSGTAKLLDLGLAKVQRQGGSDISDAGASMGTPNYISPEQAQGGMPVDTRSDIYSLGATLYHMLTAQVPFPLDNAIEVMIKHVKEYPPTPREIQPTVSPEIDAVVMTMMQKNPADRYQTPTELAADLEAVIAGKPPSVFEPEPPPQTPPPGAPPQFRSHRIRGVTGHRYIRRRPFRR